MGSPTTPSGLQEVRGGVALYCLPPLEVFRSDITTERGGPNEQKWTRSDLDAMVRNFELCQRGRAGIPLFEVPAKFGHLPMPGLMASEATAVRTATPAYGWIKDLFRDGSALYAIVGDLTETARDWLAAKRYNRVSLEGHPEPHASFAEFGLKGPVLEAISFLGAVPPEVKWMQAPGVPIPQPAGSFKPPYHPPGAMRPVVAADYWQRLRHEFAQAPRKPTIKSSVLIKRRDRFFSFSVTTIPGVTMDRQAILNELAALGVDITAIDDTWTDAQLAFWLQSMKAAMGQVPPTPPVPDQTQMQQHVPNGAGAGGLLPHTPGPVKAATYKFNQAVPVAPVYHPVAAPLNLAATVQAALAPITGQLQSLTQQLSDLDKRNSVESSNRKQGRIRQFMQSAVAAGKATPADADESHPLSLINRLMRADDTKSFEFVQSDGKKINTTELQAQLDEIDARTPTQQKEPTRSKPGMKFEASKPDRKQADQTLAEEVRAKYRQRYGHTAKTA